MLSSKFFAREKEAFTGSIQLFSIGHTALLGKPVNTKITGRVKRKGGECDLFDMP